MKKFKNLKLQNVTTKNYGDNSSPITLASKKTFSKIALASILFLSVSCSDDNNTDIENISNSNDIANNYSAEEKQLLKDGWEVIDEIELLNENDQFTKKNRQNEVKVVPLTKSLLKDIGYDLNDPDGIFWFKNDLRIDGVTPDGVKFNNSICEACDHRNPTDSPNVSIMIGPTKLTNEKNNKFTEEIKELSASFNNYDFKKTDTHNVKVAYEEGNKTTLKTTNSTSFKLGTKVQVTIAPVNTLIETSFEYTVGTQKEESIEDNRVWKSDISSIINVEPRHRRDVKVFVNRETYEADYTVPVEVVGWLQSNFSIPVKGHYYLLTHISNYPNFNKNVKPEIGKVKRETSINARVWVSPNNPIVN